VQLANLVANARGEAQRLGRRVHVDIDRLAAVGAKAQRRVVNIGKRPKAVVEARYDASERDEDLLFGKPGGGAPICTFLFPDSAARSLCGQGST
jgi:hypothetical protein